MATPVDFLNAASQEAVDGRVNEAFFPRVTFLSLIAGRGLSSKDRGRPGTRDLLGSMRPKTQAEKRSLRGSNKKQVTVMTAKFGGGTGVAYRDTAPQVNNLDTIGALEFPWTLHIQPIKIMKDDLQAAQGEHQIVDLLQRAVDQGMSELEELVGVSMLSGNPASQTATQLSEYISVISTLDVDLNTGYAGSGNRVTTDTYLLPALYHDSANLNFDWSLIDNVNRGAGGDNHNPNGGAAVLGGGVDFAFSNEHLFYQSILPKARADGHQIISSSGMQDIGLVGFERPVVKYMNTFVTFDPNMPNVSKNSAALSYLACLTMKSWEFEMHPDAAFNITKWTDLQPNTRERAFGADLELKGRLICNNPSRNGLYGNVN